MASKGTDPGSPFGVFWSVFALTALPFGLTMGAIYGDLPLGMVAGFAFGVATGFAMIPFLRVDREAFSFRDRAFSDRAQFEKRLKLELSELGYTPTRVDDDMIQFKASNAGVLEIGPLKAMSGESLTRVSVHLDDAGATFVGPRWLLRKVLARL